MCPANEHSCSSDEVAAYLDMVLDLKSHGEGECESQESGSEMLTTIACPESCSHLRVLKSVCTTCGKYVEDGYGVAFGYLLEGLRLSNSEVARLRDIKTKNLLSNKKLVLVLDLDHTLLNSYKLECLTKEETYLESQVDSLQDVSKGNLCKLESISFMTKLRESNSYMTKLRPFVRTFLQKASNMFEMYVNSYGKREYVIEMAKLLDPENRYFNSRLISRADRSRSKQKDLDMVLGQQSMVVILDDKKEMWPEHINNLIEIKRYTYFASSCHECGKDRKSYSERKSDEEETNGTLEAILEVLEQIHGRFFDSKHGVDFAARDVRKTMRTVHSRILKGSKIQLKHLRRREYLSLTTLAGRLGAICTRKLDSSVTHVVTKHAGEDDFRWVKKEKKNFLVRPEWITDSYTYWYKQPELNYTLTETNA